MVKRLFVSLVALVAVASLFSTGCSQTAPSPTPTPKAAEPTKAAAPAAQPTAASAAPTTAPAAPKVAFPEKGRPINFIVPWDAGGGSDIGARLLANDLEKVFGTPVVVVNKGGAGSQTGLTDFVRAKPDGYTIAMTNFPSTATVYLDPRRKTIFGRKDFVPLALHAEDVIGLAVRTEDQWKSVKEVFDYVKANPGKVTVTNSGILSPAHVAELLVQKQFGLKFNIVNLQSGAEEAKALLGKTADVGFATIGSAYGPLIRNNSVRPLGIAAKQPSEIWPGVPTWESQGYPFESSSSRGIALPAGTPKEIVDAWSDAMKKAIANEDTKKKMAESGMAIRYMGPDEFAKFWDDQEKALKPIVEDAAKEQ